VVVVLVDISQEAQQQMDSQEVLVVAQDTMEETM
jgi:hypothetical protein